MNDPTQSRYRYLQFKGGVIFRRFIKDEKNNDQKKSDNTTAEVPAHGTYGALLFRSEWKVKRNEIISRDKRYVICKTSDDLQVHHRQYHFIVREHRLKYPWEYAQSLMITLCKTCHKRGHDKFKVPTINI